MIYHKDYKPLLDKRLYQKFTKIPRGILLEVDISSIVKKPHENRLAGVLADCFFSVVKEEFMSLVGRNMLVAPLGAIFVKGKLSLSYCSNAQDFDKLLSDCIECMVEAYPSMEVAWNDDNEKYLTPVGPEYVYKYYFHHVLEERLSLSDNSEKKVKI